MNSRSDDSARPGTNEARWASSEAVGDAACPDARTLELFLEERMDDERADAVQRHLDDCAACRERMEHAAADDALWRGVREGLERVAIGESPASREEDAVEGDAVEGGARLLDELRAILAPTDDPSMLGRLGAYEVRGVIGEGATGFVLKAFEPRLNRFVAIKLMAPREAASAVARRRFEREGRAVAAVSHEHVVPVYGVDEQAGLPYIVMQYVGGSSLDERIERDGPLDMLELTRVGLQVARGLAAAHAQGIVHRDVKPANVLLDGSVDRVLVTDFGLAWVADEASMTRSGTIAGTPQFMSPEQARGESVDARSDLFSLGCLLYAAATGFPPFRGDTVYGVLARVQDERPRPLRELAPHVRGWFAAFVERLMAKDPAERFASADAAAAVLAAELAHLQNPAGVAQPPRDWMPRTARGGGDGAGHRAVARAGVAVAGLAGLVALVLAWPDGESSGGTAGRAGFASPWTAALDGGLGGGATGDDGYRVIEADASDWLETPDPGGGEPVAEQSIEWRVPLGDATALALDLERGGLEVVPGDGDHALLQVVRRFRGDAEERGAVLQGHALGLRHVGQRMEFVSNFGTVASSVAPDDGGRSDLLARLESCAVRLELPAGAMLHVRAHGTAVRIGATSASMRLRVEHGGVQLGDYAGDGEVWAVHSNVSVHGVTGRASIYTSSGDVFVGSNDGTLQIQTDGGSVLAGTLSGETMVHATNGRVAARIGRDSDARASLNAVGAGADVELVVADGADVRVRARGAIESGIELVELPDEYGGAGTWSTAILGEATARVSLTSSVGRVRIVREAAAPDRFDDGDGRAGGAADRSGPSSGSGLGGSGLGGSGLGGSGLGGSGFGSSGLGGSGSGTSTPSARSAAALARRSGAPRAGAIVPVEIEPRGNVDGYALYLPRSFDPDGDERYPVLVYLQGSFGVGGEVDGLIDWGLLRLLRDEDDLEDERNRMLLDGFVVVAPHIVEGGYDDHPQVVAALIDEVVERYRGDAARVSMTGLSRGGHGTWGLASELPGRFAAIVPIGGAPDDGLELRALDGTAVWLAHHTGDPIAPFDAVDETAARVERELGVRFVRHDGLVVTDADALGAEHLFTVGSSDSHDAWSDVYSSAGLYRWLLARERTPASEED